jgi:hypothetical protein
MDRDKRNSISCHAIRKPGVGTQSCRNEGATIASERRCLDGRSAFNHNRYGCVISPTTEKVLIGPKESWASLYKPSGPSRERAIVIPQMVSFSTKPMVPRANHWRMTISASGPRRRGIARAVASAIALTSTPAHADTLAQAIATAYDTNPDILAQRELLRAINERYLQARAQLGFTVDATASVQSQRAVVDSNLQTDNTVTAQTAAQSLSVIQPLYSGGRLHAALQAALANVFLNYQYVRRAQARVLTQVVTAYADVQRDQQIVAISTENVGLLQGQIDQTRAKLAVKAATLTDRDQGFARFAAAQAQLVVATARLRASESSYRAVVGQDPGKLEPVPALPDLAQTVDGFYAIAEKSSPVLLSADFQERSSRAGILQAKAATRPSLALRGDVSRGPLLPYNGQLRNDNQTVRLVLSTSRTVWCSTCRSIRQARTPRGSANRARATGRTST